MDKELTRLIPIAQENGYKMVVHNLLKLCKQEAPTIRVFWKDTPNTHSTNMKGRNQKRVPNKESVWHHKNKQKVQYRKTRSVTGSAEAMWMPLLKQLEN